MSDEGSVSTNYHTQALIRGLRILEIVASRPSATTLADLHQESGLPKSTLVRLLSALTDVSYLDRIDDRPSYRLGHKVAGLSYAYLDALDIRTLVSERLGAIAEQTRQTVNLGVLDGLEVLHVAVGTPNRVLRFDTAVGDRAPAYRTGLGKVLLAALADDDLVGHLPPDWEPAPPRAVRGSDELRKILARARNTGYASDDNEFAEGLSCIAVPVSVSGEIVAALSVSGPTGEFSAKQRSAWIKLLQGCAKDFAADPAIAGALIATRRGSRSGG